MAKRVQITNQGMALLASSSQATGQYYWLGYYVPAYVPNIWKTTGNIEFPTGDCGKVNTDGILINPTDTDIVTSSMSRLTKYGDIIYNVWQGDLTGTGYANGVSDGSAGADLYGMTMYDKNIKKHYRYVLDSNGNNTLVAWIINPNATDGSLLGYHVYKGTDGFYQSTMPIPAPLYYLGDTLGRSTTEDYFINSPYFDDEYYNGASQYPSIEVVLENLEVFDVPKVSIDHRKYMDSNGVISTPFSVGTYFDSNPIPPSPTYDDTGWYSSDMGLEITDTDVVYCTEFWKLHTISNYNRFHASVDSVGHVLNTDLSNRNMAKSTKLFPIANYKVINTETGYTSNNERVEVATAIKLSIDIDLSPNSLHQGLTGTSLNQNNELGFFDLYENAGTSGLQDQFGNDLYKTVHNSFKFNRIGIYAVPLRSSPIMSDNGFGYETQNDVARVQFQINPDEEPVLFAVIDWDNTVILSDTGDGIHQFKGDFDINLQSLAGVSDTPLIRNATIFYNLYQDDAQTWYQNQLIATASTSNAITELGLEIANLKNNSNGGDCCPPPDLSNQFASKDHTHNNFLRNLVDSNDKLNGGLRGIDSYIEGTLILGDIYKLGLDSISLGLNTAVFGDNSIVASGYQNYILANVQNSIIGSGLNNLIYDENNYVGIFSGAYNKIESNSTGSVIAGGYSNYINATYNFIGAGFSNTINASSRSFIGSGLSNIITATGGMYNFILSGQSNAITSSSVSGSGILSGNSNIIEGNSVTNSFIGAGLSNKLSNLATNSSILSGQNNEIFNVSRSSIASGYRNYILGTANDSFIGAGQYNYIDDAANGSFIGSGNHNYISDGAYNSSIVSGNRNYILNSSYQSSILGGSYNYILDGANHSSILSGNHNYIYNTSHDSLIGSGQYNYIYGTSYNSFIGSGDHNYIYDGSNNSAIIGGSYNEIYGSSSKSFIGSGFENYITLSSGNACGAIITGNANAIQGAGINAYTFIGNGNTNKIDSDTGCNNGYSAILNGQENTIISTSNDSCLYSFIGNGYLNTISNSARSAILGGSNNSISGFDDTFIIGSSIIADRSSATFINSLALHGSTMSIGSLTPNIGSVPTVASVSSTVATLEWKNPNTLISEDVTGNQNILSTIISHNKVYIYNSDTVINNTFTINTTGQNTSGLVFYIRIKRPASAGTSTINIKCNNTDGDYNQVSFSIANTSNLKYKTVMIKCIDASEYACFIPSE